MYIFEAPNIDTCFSTHAQYMKKRILYLIVFHKNGSRTIFIIITHVEQNTQM